MSTDKLILLRFAGDNNFFNSVRAFGAFILNAIEYHLGENERLFDPEVLQSLWRAVGPTMYRVYQAHNDQETWKSFGDLQILVDSDAAKKLETYSSWGNHDGVLLSWDSSLLKSDLRVL